jgi:hypothetical protein
LRDEGKLTVFCFEDLFEFEKTLSLFKGVGQDFIYKSPPPRAEVARTFDLDVISIKDYFDKNRKIHTAALKPYKIKVRFRRSGEIAERIN